MKFTTRIATVPKNLARNAIMMNCEKLAVYERVFEYWFFNAERIKTSVKLVGETLNRYKRDHSDRDLLQVSLRGEA